MTTSPAATGTSTSLAAMCSFAAIESGANIGTPSTSSSSTAGARTSRSMRTSWRQTSKLSNGRIAPTTTNDVRDAIGSADNGEQDQRGGEVRRRRDQGDRDAPEDESDTERGGEPSSLERHRSEGAHQAADADRGRQVADGAGAGPEQAERRYDDQHV